MQTDDELAALFDRAVADLTPNVNTIVHRAEQLGRKLRRRMRIRRAAGTGVAVLAVSGVGAGAWLAHPLSGLGGSASASADSGLAGAAASSGQPVSTPASQLSTQPGLHKASESPAVTPTPASTPASTPMTRRQMLRTLRGLLPAGAVLTDDPTAATEPGSLEVNYDDGHGKVDLLISIGPVDPTALTCPNPLWTDEGARPAGALPISCLVRTPPGGGVERDAVMYADSYGFYGYDIYDQRPDKVVVFIQVGNGYFDPYLPHVDRATPPGSMSLWESVVESPAWHA
jgi:hypothetical protein